MIGVVWQPSPPIEEIITLLKLISLIIDTKNIFTACESTIYQLRGLIAYYGKHFWAWFYNPYNKQWYSFDDKNVKTVGDSWEDVVNILQKGKFEPFVLFYERVTSKSGYYHNKKPVLPQYTNEPNNKKPGYVLPPFIIEEAILKPKQNIFIPENYAKPKQDIAPEIPTIKPYPVNITNIYPPVPARPKKAENNTLNQRPLETHSNFPQPKLKLNIFGGQPDIGKLSGDIEELLAVSLELLDGLKAGQNTTLSYISTKLQIHSDMVESNLDETSSKYLHNLTKIIYDALTNYISLPPQNKLKERFKDLSIKELSILLEYISTMQEIFHNSQFITIQL